MTRRYRSDDGATAVETALVLPVALAVIFFTLYGALFFYYSAIADHVARTVAREVSIPVGQTGSGYPSAAAAATDAANTGNSLIPAPCSSCVVTTSQGSSGTPQEGDLVTISVTYHLPVFDQLGSLVPGLSSLDTLTRSATERRQ